MNRGVSLAKFNDKVANEDSFFATGNCVAVSDGAGGCGLFADEWSAFLISRLPKETPVCSFAELDAWVDGIWEQFYNGHEAMAKQGDGMFLNKFYKEGSCATIAAVWRTAAHECRWMSYGDSVVFHYSRKTDRLEHSFSRLPDFGNPPRLVSCKDPLEEEGFRSGTFQLDDSSAVFVASDALSHYILMMYELSRCNEYVDELRELQDQRSSNSQLLRVAAARRCDFVEDVLVPLQRASVSVQEFEKYVRHLHAQGLLDMDDYTMAWLKFDIEGCGGE